MIRPLFLFTLLLLLFADSSGQTTVFNKLIDFNNQPNHAQSIVELNDGFILMGTVPYTTHRALLLTKTDGNGNLIWHKEYGKMNEIIFSGPPQAFIRTSDGGFLLGSTIQDTLDTAPKDGIIIKFNNVGDTLWKKHYSGKGNDAFNACIEIDNSYYAFGWSELEGGGDGDFLLIKIDLQGNEIWKKYIGTTNNDYGNSFVKTIDGGFLLIGSTDMSGGRLLLIKTDAEGNKIWQKTRNLNIFGLGAKIISLKDGNYLLTSAKDNLNSNGWEGYIAKIDPNGNFLWEKTFGDEYHDWLERAVELDNGDIIAVGSSTNTHYNIEWGWFVRINQNGDEVWQKRHYAQPDKINWLFDLKRTSDGGLISVGSGRGNTQDIWLLKLDENGNTCSTVGCDSVVVSVPEVRKEIKPLNIFPNPGSGHFSIFYKSAQPAVLSVYDIKGQFVYQKALEQGSENHQIKLPSYLPNGMYQCIITSEGQVKASGRMMLSK
jgi:hypothetical protein